MGTPFDSSMLVDRGYPHALRELCSNALNKSNHDGWHKKGGGRKREDVKEEVETIGDEAICLAPICEGVPYNIVRTEVHTIPTVPLSERYLPLYTAFFSGCLSLSIAASVALPSCVCWSPNAR
jgi:hypothetical protein